MNSEPDTLTVMSWHARGDALSFAPQSQKRHCEPILHGPHGQLEGLSRQRSSPHIFTQLGANRVERAASKTYLPRRKITV